MNFLKSQRWEILHAINSFGSAAVRRSKPFPQYSVLALPCFFPNDNGLSAASTLKGLSAKPREVTIPRICLEGVCLQMVIHQLKSLTHTFAEQEH